MAAAASSAEPPASTAEALSTSLLVPATADGPSSAHVTPMLTDMYQVTMVYAYWKSGHQDDHAVFDMFFRKNPFAGEYTVFAGMEECVRFIQTFHFDDKSIAFLKTILPSAEAGFFDFLAALDTSEVIVHSLPEGTVVFSRVPCLRVEGPLAICQLLETTLLNLTNFASLMATNACRFRQAAGPDVALVEFGLRRAQGPDGALSASRYSYIGGFDATSNLSAAMIHGIEPRGTHAHSFVSAFTSFADLTNREIGGVDLVKQSIAHRETLGFDTASDSELAAFVAYALAFPNGFLALVDTYDTLQSGVPNFLAVGAALQDAGYTPRGIRLDSGDLAYLSKEARSMFKEAEAKLGDSYKFAGCTIMASNDINEAVLHSLNDQGHELDALGVGTHLVTCQRQPALGMVYKLVQIEGKPRIKISQDISKVTIPGAKNAFRLIGRDNVPILDLLVPDSEAPPTPGRRLLCHHPFEDKRRVYVTATKVIRLLNRVWVGSGADTFATAAAERAEVAVGAAAAAAGTSDAAAVAAGSPACAAAAARAAAASSRRAGAELGVRARFSSPTETRAYVKAQIAILRTDHVRPLNPTPYKVSVTAGLFHFIHELWGREVPVTELC